MNRLLPGQPLYRILVTDDQLDNRILLARFLQRLGLDVQEATSGAEAVQKWQTWHPHLIWMDIRMVGMTGYEAMQQIRALEQQSQPGYCTPIIAITAQAYEEDRHRALTSGFTDFVTKPFEITTIFQQLTMHLGLQYQYGEAIDLHSNSTFSAANLKDEQPVLTPQSLQVMSPEWVAALHQAALNCSSLEVENLISQIPPQYDTLAQGLKRLVHEFEFEGIMHLSEQN
ncbi:MAG TPA: response regulator [Leptolyngbyaceae cyanobacterium M33_DOE_097]|uniref:Response regulator n=1 Tax=Oscillatoriales cyanobacterium SpSt-418 TaxID=2282169 RepID=A0A7C3PJ02_9CYAN|nr:response regulator [Leptolyngbyaceae cyanobacterium M33_DOE_097]